MALKFTPQAADFTKSTRIFMRKKNASLGWIGIAFYLPLSLLHARLVFYDNSSALLYLLAFIVLAFPLFFIFRIWFSSVNVDQSLIKPIEWTLSENGLFVKTEITTLNLDWEMIHNVFESTDYYFLVLKNKTTFLFLPKRVFADSDSEEVFRETLSAKYGDIQSTAANFGSKASLFLLVILYVINMGMFFYSNFQAAF